MAKQNLVIKRYIKTWCIGNFYYYLIYEVNAGGEIWYEAVPKTRGVTRTSEDEKTLRIILENDVVNINKFWAKVR